MTRVSSIEQTALIRRRPKISLRAFLFEASSFSTSPLEQPVSSSANFDITWDASMCTVLARACSQKSVLGLSTRGPVWKHPSAMIYQRSCGVISLLAFCSVHGRNHVFFTLVLHDPPKKRGSSGSTKREDSEIMCLDNMPKRILPPLTCTTIRCVWPENVRLDHRGAVFAMTPEGKAPSGQ